MSTNTDNDSPRFATAANHEFRIGDETAAIYAGELHYWRLDRGHWETILDRMRGMGLTTASIYIPWEAHEIERGRFDFGEIEPSNDLDAFLTLCEEKGLYVVARLGPQINAEMTWFGYPRRILEDSRLHARNAQGGKVVLNQVPQPVPALSYAAEEFFEETALYYDALCPILARHKYPNGGLVSAQVDNEMVFFFTLNPYAADFSPAAVRNYRAFLREKYADLEELNEVYGQSYTDFEEIEPPRSFEATGREDIPYHVDWIEYRERYLVDGISRLSDMLKDRGLDGIPLFHNYPHPLGAARPANVFATPQNLSALEERLDFVGFDIYFKKEMYDYLKTTVSYVVGTSRYPYVPELFTGTWPWFVDPGTLEDEEFVAKASLMQGVKGFSRYVLVERDRWMASPIRRDGRVRDDLYEMYRRVHEMAREHRFADLRRQSGVLLLANREYDRLEAASVLVSFPGDFLETPTTFPGYPSPMYASEGSFGFSEPVQLAKTERFTDYRRGLTEAGYEFLVSDTALPPERWQNYGAVVLASFEYLSAATQRALVEYAEAGGRVVLGPRIPHLDERMRPDETLQSALEEAEGRTLTVDGAEAGRSYGVGRGSIVHLDDLSDATGTLEAALEGLGLVRPAKNDARLDVAVHRDTTDASRLVVFVANPTSETIHAEVGLEVAPSNVTDLWEGRRVTAEDGTLRETLEPYTVGIYECVT